MDDKLKRLFNAIDTLQRYSENPKNPLSGPEFSRLVNDVFAAKDDLIASGAAA